jgi:hypothetical protein
MVAQKLRTLPLTSVLVNLETPSGRNLTDEDYFNQVFLQSSPGYPDTYELGFGLNL